MKRTRVISTVLILSIVLIMGFLATWLTWSLTTRKLTREILNQAGLVAQSINISRLMTLQGNEQDLESANYLRIKEQLTQIRKNLSRCRFLYLMGKREDGAIFFYMDAQSVDSEDYAPPGLIYEEVPEEYLQTFNTGKSQVVGPITDRWGTLISGLVPIYAADNNRLLAVLGMDIEADDWHRYILFQCSLPVGLTIFVLLLISLFLFVNPQREKDEKQVRTIVLFMLAVLFPGMFLTWYTWGYTNNQMRESALEQARLVARSISVKRIQNLKGDQTDLNSQDYQRIKEQLFLIRKSHSTCRFLYLMGQKEDGTVFFFLDSQPTTSSDYAPPGLVYKEVSAEYLEHFKNAKDGTVGPITDRWGTLVTSLVPIFSNEDNQLIAILGMDIDTRDWKEKAILQCLLPIGLTLFIMFLTFSLLILNENRKTIRKQNLEIKEKHAESKRLLHILCHDLANPIGNMDLILEALKSDPTQLEELLDLATIANNNALEIIELVRNIREIDENKIGLELKQYPLADLINESLAILTNRIEQKDIRLKLSIPEDCTVTVEKTSFVNTVINNLLTNAIKFSDPGSCVEITAVKESATVIMVIQDYGIGMPNNLLDDIFDITKKTNRPGTSGEQGTGFGMPLVKRFVEEYRGTIEISSKIAPKDRGTKIKMILPV